MKFEKTEVWGLDHAFRGMRNPKESWHLSDSKYEYDYDEVGWCTKEFIIGKNDLKLAQTLIKAGSEHRKFMRQIFVSVDITAPLFWWKEFDTYKVGVTTNSTSTMQKLANTPITLDCFEMNDFTEHFDDDVFGSEIYMSDIWETQIRYLETLRNTFNKTKDKRYWKELIRLLPESWLQKRTITMNYENVLNMIRQRRTHRLSEWSVSFIEWAKTLPYAKELLFI